MIPYLLTFFAGIVAGIIGTVVWAVFTAASWADDEMEARPWVIPSDDRDDSST
jgi:hypothetical protein